MHSLSWKNSKIYNTQKIKTIEYFAKEEVWLLAVGLPMLAIAKPARSFFLCIFSKFKIRFSQFSPIQE
jgi:hypothetical protein